MPFTLPAPVLQALHALAARGYPAYVVGGCVRDMLRGAPPHDYDICTAASPAETRACFAGYPVIDTGIQHGTVTAVIDRTPLEITTFRVDGEYSDGRHPQSVAFTRDITRDLARRDFTVNAMAWRPGENVTDPFGGQKDLAQGVIRCVGEARERFTEDALRILRAMRFASELGFSIEQSTAQAMHLCRSRLKCVSRERVAAELIRLVAGGGAPGILRAFYDVLFTVLPALAPMRGRAQALPYPVDDQWEHALCTLQNTPPGDQTLRMAALLQSCGQPSAQAQENANRLPEEQRADASLARDILLSLRLSTRFINEATQLVLLHDQPISVPEAALWLSRLGQAQFERLIALKRASLLASAPAAGESPDCMERLLSAAQRALKKGYPLALRDLAVNGSDLAALGLPRGPLLGQTLERLHLLVLTDQLPNDKAALLAEARRIVNNA